MAPGEVDGVGNMSSLHSSECPQVWTQHTWEPLANRSPATCGTLNDSSFFPALWQEMATFIIAANPCQGLPKQRDEQACRERVVQTSMGKYQSC